MDCMDAMRRYIGQIRCSSSKLKPLVPRINTQISAGHIKKYTPQMNYTTFFICNLFIFYQQMYNILFLPLVHCSAFPLLVYFLNQIVSRAEKEKQT